MYLVRSRLCHRPNLAQATHHEHAHKQRQPHGGLGRAPNEKAKPRERFLHLLVDSSRHFVEHGRCPFTCGAHMGLDNVVAHVRPEK